MLFIRAQRKPVTVSGKQENVTMLKQFLGKFELEPKRLFLIDGLGAILTAVLLGVVLVRFERFFGIPSSILYFLAIPPIFFAIYDFLSYKKDNIKIGQFLKGIAIMNLLYCCLSIGFAFYHTKTITILGWTYILIEISIVITLSIIELRIANRLNKRQLKAD